MTTTSTTYRLDRRLALRIFGWRMVLAGIGAMAVFAAFGLGGSFVLFGWILLALTLALVVAAAWTMSRPPLVIALTSQGIRLGRTTGSSIRRAHWMSIDNVSTEKGAAGIGLAFTLEAGGTCEVPLLLVPRRASELQREVHQRLNTANGYRPLN